MRLVVTKCHLCGNITGAKHADTIEELEDISAFIREKKRLFQSPTVLDYSYSDETLIWCRCTEELSNTAT